MVTTASVEELISGVFDPEIPVLSITDLGVLRGVEVDGEVVRVSITPTYSGCPALGVIEEDIVSVLTAAGYDRVAVETVWSPAWTTDWLSDDARRRLEEYGIAPPAAADTDPVLCPQCAGSETRLVSEFGSTACKALMVCSRCGEPFDYFKQI